MASPAYSEGPFSWGPKCAKLAGFTPDSYRKQIEQPEIDPRQMALIQDAPVIQAGHKYQYFGVEVIAIEPDQSGDGSWWVRPIAIPWMLEARKATPEQLHPAPMKYYNGQIPS
jgi:hypothetical protein